MAYREKTFNANVLTDLLGTYLTHKSNEREKYYKAAEKASKPELRSVGGNLVNVYQDGSVETVYEGPKKAETKFYDEKTKRMIYGTSQEAYGKPTKAPDVPINYQEMGMDYLESMKGRNPGLNLSLFEKNLSLIDTEDEWKTWKSEMNKEETRDVSNKKSNSLAEARELIRANNKLYNELGSETSFLDPKKIEKDYNARKREKRALQKIFKAYNSNKTVYLNEDFEQLKTDYINQIRKSGAKIPKEKIEEIKKMNASQIFNEVERMNEIAISRGKSELPFWIHKNRYRGFDEFSSLLESMGNVSK
tara:strand:- start:161 stop:1075 length:915 start_codon:yes stop_codon:yes gene_type:complete